MRFVAFTVRLPVALWEALKARADAEGESMQTVVRAAIRRALED